MKRPKLILILSSILLAACALAAYKRHYPYGYRPCQLPCFVGSLTHYSIEHDGWFPKSTSNRHALSLLYPTYAEDGIAGLSHPEHKTIKALKENRFTALDTSWVYFEGLRNDDPHDLLLLYERTPNIGFNGQRIQGYAVGYVGGGFNHIHLSEDAWNEYLKNHEIRRLKVLNDRASKGLKQ